MSRSDFKTRKRFEIPHHLRYLTFSCYHRLQLFGNPKIRDAFVDSLVSTRDRLGFKLTAWVIMPEHVHLMIVPPLPATTAADVLEALKGHHANRVLRRWRKLDAPVLPRLLDTKGKSHFWQIGGGHDRNVFTLKEYEEKVNYIHNNPVKRGLVATPVDWLWSSARWYAGLKEDVLIEIDPLGS